MYTIIKDAILPNDNKTRKYYKRITDYNKTCKYYKRITKHANIAKGFDT